MGILRRLRTPVGLVLALAADLLLFGGPHRPDLRALRSLEAALTAQASVNEDWLGRPGIVGTAVGLGDSGEHVVRVYLAAPGVAVLPAFAAGVPVQSEVSGPFVALDPALAPDGPGPAATDPPATAERGDPRDHGGGEVDRQGTFARPVPLGVSTGHRDVTAGTIGARVTDRLGGVYALSNNHVYAAGNAGRKGDPVFQPGMLDGARDPDDVLGALADFEPIRFCSAGACPFNRIDAAIAGTTTDDLDGRTPDDGYGEPRPRPVEAALGATVQKYGRTTGLTHGRITGIHATIDVQYRGGIARFEEQIVVGGSDFGAPGDSGSLIVTEGALLGDRRPVALLFAGSSSSTLANPIGPVLERFGVRVDGSWR